MESLCVLPKAAADAGLASPDATSIVTTLSQALAARSIDTRRLLALLRSRRRRLRPDTVFVKPIRWLEMITDAIVIARLRRAVQELRSPEHSELLELTPATINTGDSASRPSTPKTARP